MKKTLAVELQKRISRVALERMEAEHADGFQFISRFRSDTVGRFLAWIATVDKRERLEAALSVTCRQLRLRGITCKLLPNFERWATAFGNSPLYIDRTWRPNQYSRAIVSALKKSLEPSRLSSTRCFDVEDDHPLAIRGVRAWIAPSTKVADVVVHQLVRSAPNVLDISYLSLMGLGPTGWQVREAADVAGIAHQVPEVILKAREVMAVGPSF